MRRLRLLAPFLIICAGCTKPPDVVSLHASVVAAMQDGELEKAQILLDKTFGKGVLLSSPANPDTLIRPGLSQMDVDRLRLLQSEILLEQGNNPDALKLLDHIQDPHDPESHLRWLVNRAVVLNRIGNVDQARALLQMFDADSGTLASTGLVLKANLLRGNLISQSSEKDKYEKVGALFRETASIAQREGLPFYENAALMNLSRLSLQRGRYDESVGYSLHVLETGNRRLAAGAHNNLDVAYYFLGDLEKAEKHGAQAIDLSQKSGDTRTRADALGNLANVNIEQRKFDDAVKLLLEARRISVETGARLDAYRWAGNLATAHLAAYTYITAKGLDSDNRASNELAEAERANSEAYALRKSLENPPKPWLLEFNAAEIAAARAQFAEAEKLYRMVIDEKPDDFLNWAAHARLGKLFVTQKRIQDAKLEYELALAAAEDKRSAINQAESRITFRNNLIRFFWNYVDLLVSEGQYNEALEVVEYSRARVMAEKLGREPRTFQQVRASTFQAYAHRTGDVMLSYWMAPGRSFVWVVTANGIHWKELPDRQVISDAISAYSGAIEGLRDPVAENLDSGDKLTSLLLDPVKEYLAGARRVIIVPDGNMHLLNMETLPVVTKAGKQYWIESAELAVTPSLILLSQESLATKASATPNLLLYGAPISPVADYPDLPGTKTEIAGIGKYFEGRETIVEGAKATPRFFAAAMPESYSMIHFAAHAEAVLQSPLDSAIILSKDDQGFKLYAREIARLQLTANLVTLSSCHSAGAKSYNGEGMVGFAWAFMLSGVHNVIAGLWDVDDAYSSRMMITLYKGIASGKRPSSALREAKLEMLKTNATQHKPVYWAPYQTYLR
jgi:CHAT domain-containing protein/predicted negative regulator of RcsB-dependent stress response